MFARDSALETPCDQNRAPANGHCIEISNTNTPALLDRARRSNTEAPTRQDMRQQTSLLQQSSSYLKQATNTFLRWQSRRAFWSAVGTAGADVQGPRVACANTRLALAHWFQTTRTVARQHPSLVLVPLLLCCASMAGGLCGVLLAAKRAGDQRRVDAAATARQAAAALELLVEDRALLPAAALAALVREEPNMTALVGALPRLGQRLLQPPSTVAAVRQLLLAPFGADAAVLVPTSTAGSHNGSVVVAVRGGRDVGGGDGGLLNDPIWGQGVALAAQAQAPVVVASVGQPPGSNGGPSEVLLTIHHPVYVPSAVEHQTWGNEAWGAANSSGLCGGSACYNASTRTKLWGFTSSLVSISALMSATDSRLDSLTEKSFKYRVTVQLSGGRLSEAVEVAASSKQPSAHCQITTVPIRLTGPVAAGAAVAAIPDGGAAGELVVYDSWQPVWLAPLVAVVVLVSLALCAVAFVMLLAYWRHMAMLRAMLPDKAIDVLSRGYHYYEHFDCTTVLYADVVRYTTAATQQQQQQQPGSDSVPTLEVVKLLNDVHSMYEAIIKKYGLVRIRRSGESFLCVGGCPSPDDPVAVAVRVASCARDMVAATAGFRGSGGFRVQIRVGLHTGPVVAAVVGSKMPRFSLFGDVVDVAYYLEATSRAMAVHVSNTTAHLLAAAGDPLLQLRPRGRLDILGQPAMDTCWLQVTALPDEEEDDGGPAAATEAGAGVAGGGSRSRQERREAAGATATGPAGAAPGGVV